MGKKAITIEEVKKRIFEKWGDIITLKEETYKNTNDSCIFIDKQFGEFSAHPHHVFTGHGHRKRGYETVSKKLSTSKITKTLLEEFPEIAKEWHLLKNNYQPSEVAFKSAKKAWWKCGTCSHEWKSSIGNRTEHGNGCPSCSGRVVSGKNSLKNSSITAVLDWDHLKNKISLDEVCKGTHSKYNWICHVCGEEWIATPNNRTKPGGSGCPNCIHKTTKLEAFYEQNVNIKKFDKTVIANSKVRPDFKHSESVFVNVHGLWVHGLWCDNNKHYNQRILFENNNLRLFQFYEDEVYNKIEIIKSIINNAIGNISKKIMARKCFIKIISQKEMDSFLNENHLMGTSRGVTAIGLFHENELISCMTFQIKTKDGHIRISRFCSKNNTIVHGGFQKFLSFIEQIAVDKKIKMIESHCDLRYGTGQSYLKAGFKFIHITKSFEWTDRVNRYNRLACQSIPGGKDENELASERKWFKIYNAGQALYIKYI